MGEVRLGKIHLRWCDRCDVPILEQKSCGTCGSETREVKVTPPGDARPAFEGDLVRVRRLVDEQFGPGTGELAIPPGRLVLLNKAPDIDRTDEVVRGGYVVGAVRFSLASGEKMLLRPETAARIASKATRSWVRVDGAAAKAIREKSASALAVGVLECAPDISPGAEVIVIGPEGDAVTVGSAKMTSEEMLAHKRGTAVKSRWTVPAEFEPPEGKKADWSDVVSANREVMNRRTSEAIDFVRRTLRENDLPVAVSYSGGKDSLATLLLVLDAGITPSILFVDTGLEFKETKDNVQEVAHRYGLELITESAGDSFWKNLDFFGPPAKDFRWCCKTCKLGPATRLIQRSFPEGVLSFIGQRAYESEQRARKGRVWRNPWTPGQLGASPIQRWTALHVWIYLQGKGANVNPLYSEGLERIGCFMCPATDLSELRRVREIADEYARWQEYLDEYARRSGLPESWKKHDLWRWKRIPKSVLEELGDEGRGIAPVPTTSADSSSLVFRSTSGYSPCVEGLSMEGMFSRRLDMARVANMLSILGEVTTSPDGDIAEVEHMTVFAEGPVMIKARDEKELQRKSRELREIVFRATNCAGCGICMSRCPAGAMTLDGRAKIDTSLCNHCGSCLGPCPVVAFREEELDI